MSELIVNGVEYRIGTLDAFAQFHVQRRIAPVMMAFGGSLIEMLTKNVGKIKNIEEEGQETNEEELGPDKARTALDFMRPVMEVVAKMSDEDTEYILKKCLVVVSRREGDKWAPVMHSNGRLLYQDLKMQELVRLTVEVVKGNLGDFFSALPGEKS